MDNSGKLFDHFYKVGKLKTDKELSELIGLYPYVISKIRNGKQGVTKTNKYDIERATGMSISDQEKLIGGKK